ncbi:MAG: hypothetical protein M0R80_25865 [Proteobacteria bacterium]|jgi:hypothetical protein|nr:hypothetical protein [Pseudomonadota bacterium]
MEILSTENSLGEDEICARAALSDELSGKTAVYLDMKYWILLREAASGNPRGEHDATLLALVREKVASGVVFCPIGEATRLELLKQSDPGSRLATVKIIGDLSLGVALDDPLQLIETEICFSLFQHLGVPFPSPHRSAWIRFTVLDSNGLEDEARTKLNERTARVADQLNDMNAASSCEHNTYQKVFSTELGGLADLCGGKVMSIAVELARLRGLQVQGGNEEQLEKLRNVGRHFLSLVLERDFDSMPTLHIMASLHASIRWHKNRKLKPNDLFDFDHAAAAIAYCDIFLTEKPLCSMVKQRHLALDERYHCRVIADPSEAIECLRCLQ